MHQSLAVRLRRPLALAATLGVAIAGPSFSAGSTPSAVWFATDGFKALAVAPVSAAPVRLAQPVQPIVEFGAPAQPRQGGHHASGVVRGTSLSPQGDLVAVQVDMGPRPMAWLVRADDRTGQSTRRLVPQGYGEFLGWHPDGRRVAYKALDLDVADPGLWIVDTRTGGHRRVATPGLTAPQGILAAAFSPDGTRLAFATSRGMGFGSEIWEVGLDGSGRRQLRSEPNAIVGSLAWAPGGQSLAYNTLFDSPVPFAPAGLWVLDLASLEAQYLTQMDGGHGEEPIWSRDGAALFFVARENAEDRLANHRPEALVSSIRSVDVRSGRETVLVAADGARQIDLASTPQGDLLFVSNRSGALEVWSLDARGAAAQITRDGNPKRHPVMVSNR